MLAGDDPANPVLFVANVVGVDAVGELRIMKVPPAAEGGTVSLLPLLPTLQPWEAEEPVPLKVGKLLVLLWFPRVRAEPFPPVGVVSFVSPETWLGCEPTIPEEPLAIELALLEEFLVERPFEPIEIVSIPALEVVCRVEVSGADDPEGTWLPCELLF